MPQRSHSVTNKRNSASEMVWRFWDRDNKQIPITFEDLIFFDGRLLEPSRYAIYDDGIIPDFMVPHNSVFQAVKL